MELLNHRFKLMRVPQIKRNLSIGTKYKNKNPRFIQNAYILLKTIGVQLLIAYIIHKIVSTTVTVIINSPLNTNLSPDDIMSPSSFTITIVYLIFIYRGIIKFNNEYANRNIISRNYYKELESNLYSYASRINTDQEINEVDMYKQLKQYNKIFQCLILPSNTEIIMHKKHINTLIKQLDRINSNEEKERLIGLNNIQAKRIYERRHNNETKLNYHKDAIDLKNIQVSIENFYFIQDTIKQYNPSYTHRENTIMFSIHKFKTVQQVRNILRGM